MKFTIVKIIVIVGGGIALLFFAVLWGGSYFLPSMAKQVQEPLSSTADTKLEGSRAPYFDLPNLAGDHVTLSDYVDTPLVVVFWASWNGESTDEMHILDEYLAGRSEGEKLAQVVAIDSQEEHSVVSSFMRRGGYQAPVLLDTLGRTTESYHIKSLPTFYFIDRAGVVRDIYTGVLSQKMLGDKVEKILQ